jgi:hypothetical protein
MLVTTMYNNDPKDKNTSSNTPDDTQPQFRLDLDPDEDTPFSEESENIRDYIWIDEDGECDF